MKYKKLLVSGCSFTENHGSWAYCLATKYNLELINLAVQGAGNNHIVWSLLSYIEKNQIDPETTLVGVMWSHPIRNDLIFEKNDRYSDQSIFKYKYDNANSLVILGDLLKREVPQFYNLEVAKEKLLTRGNRSALAFKTWTLKTALTAYLTSKNFDFFQTGFINYFTESLLIKTNTNWDFQKEFSYVNELNSIGLSYKLSNWLSLSDQEYLGEYAFHNNLLDFDKFHPSQSGHEHWSNEILIPKLKELKILT
jgi:hypothetical protein